MPDVSTVHHDASLKNVSIAYRNAAFVSPAIAPNARTPVSCTIADRSPQNP